jgi:competence protein ComFA
MMFPLLEAVLASGGKAAIGTPRRDVVLELAPRLARAFPGIRQSVLYGGSPDRFEAGDLTLATTHQLIRFREAFDLVVIDELDAYPYHNNPQLHFAAAQSRTRNGTTVLLSATPPPGLQRQARSGTLAHARVPVRFHRRPLPAPRRINIPPVARWSERGRTPARLLKALAKSARRGAQLFVFVPYIRQVEPLVACFRRRAAVLGLSPEAVAGTSSQDADRSVKVSAFRDRQIRLLVTTTILERGVTIPKSDVFVLDADNPLFDASSLVQMAGRAGRSADDPDGFVYFAALHWTNSQRNAAKQIKEMNAYARRTGYLSS